MSCRKAGPDSSGILSLSNSCLRPPHREEDAGQSWPTGPGPVPTPKVSTGRCNPLPVLGLQRQYLTEPPSPQQPCMPKTRAPPFTQEDTEALVGDTLLVATQVYLPPECDWAPSTKLCLFPGSKRHWKMQLKSQWPLLTTWRCLTLSGEKALYMGPWPQVLYSRLEARVSVLPAS